MLVDCVLAAIMLGFTAWTYELLGRSEHAAYLLGCCLLVLLWRSVVLSAPAVTTAPKLLEGEIDAKALPPTPTKPAIRPVTCNPEPTPSEKLILTSLIDEPIGSIRILVGPQGAYGGRLEKNEIILEDSVVSRVHFSLSCVRNTYYLQDVGSTTGTFLYLAPHETRLLSMHDHVKIGDTEFRIVDASFHGKSSPYLQIKFTKGPMEGVTQRIGASVVTIGRKTSCTLCIENDVTVSGAHCTIEFRAASEPLSTSSVELDSDDERLCGFYLTDLGSTNGTGFRLSPSGLPSEKTRLHHGDVFGVGCTRFLVQHASKLHEQASTRIA